MNRDRIKQAKAYGLTVLSDDKGEYVAPASLTYYVNDAMTAWNAREGIRNFHRETRFVGFQAGAELLWVGVVSYLGDDILVDVDDATEIAIDLLQEKNWFTDPGQCEATVVI